MANYTDESVLRKVDGTEARWTTKYSPNDKVPVSGIYRCVNCKREVTCNEGDGFPPQNHDQHTPGKPILWKLNIRTNTTGEL
ncbi:MULTISPECIES: protein L [unclassified Pseudomonas]|uniref:protein L n=1 Tax=unclassified Pseudomonas TaxID=196821 RepID=UPI0009EC9DBF|nr:MULTISPECIES: protein L [unclassified Pseudomonas]RAH03833.1 protein L [Pseudomonas sp. Leaf98]